MNLQLLFKISQNIFYLNANRMINRYPYYALNHLITLRCNMLCPYCYVSGPEQKAYNAKKYPSSLEMSAEEIKNFYQELLQHNFFIFVIVGGEPLLRNDLGDCLSVLKDKTNVTVFTNGFLLPQKYEMLKDISLLYVSIDAPDERHDKLRGVKNTFKNAMTGIDLIRKKYPNIKININTTLNIGNINLVKDMIKFADKNKLAIAFQPPSYEGQFAVDERPYYQSKQNDADLDSLSTAYKIIKENALKGKNIIGSIAFFDYIINQGKIYKCFYPGCALGPVYPNGDVIDCTTSKVFANIRRQKISEILAVNKAKRERIKRGFNCQFGCRDWGLHDGSAIYNRKIILNDIYRYGKAFA